MNKSKKGKKMDLGEFLGDFPVEQASLPTAPSGMPSRHRGGDHPARDRPSGEGYGGRAERGFGGGDRGGDRDEWRGRQEGSHGGFHERSYGRYEDGPRNGPREDAPPPPPSKADQDNQWRSSGIVREEVKKPVSAADQDDQWRRPAPAPSASSDDWRRSSATTQPRVADSEDSGRPRLMLKKPGASANETDSSTPSTSAAAPGKDSGDKWDRLFANKNADRSSDAGHHRFGDVDRDRERVREFEQKSSSFSRGPPRDVPAAFGGGGRREPRRDEYERRPAPFGSGNRNAYEPRMERDRGGARFGGGRFDNDRGDSSRLGGPAPSADKNEYLGGMERLRMRDRPSDGVAPAPETRTATPPPQATETVAVEKPKPEPEVKKEKPAPPPKIQLSEEELIAIADGLLKTYLVGENKKLAIVDAKKLSESYYPKFVQKCIVKVYDEGVKECKLIVSLWAHLVKEEVLKCADISQGFDIVCSKSPEGDKASTIRKLGALCLDTPELDGILEGEVSDAVLEIAFADRKKRDGDEVQDNQNSNLVEKALGQAPGKALDILGKDASSTLVLAFLEQLFQSQPKLVAEPTCAWCDKSQYGVLLHHFFAREEPSSDLIAIQVKFLVSLQKAFKVVGFPRAADNNQSLFERTMMKLYNDDIVSPDAIVDWKDDTTETDGKLDAIVQLSQFIDWLEQEDESDDEDSDESD